MVGSRLHEFTDSVSITYTLRFSNQIFARNETVSAHSRRQTTQVGTAKTESSSIVTNVSRIIYPHLLGFDFKESIILLSYNTVNPHRTRIQTHVYFASTRRRIATPLPLRRHRRAPLQNPNSGPPRKYTHIYTKFEFESKLLFHLYSPNIY